MFVKIAENTLIPSKSIESIMYVRSGRRNHIEIETAHAQHIIENLTDIEVKDDISEALVDFIYYAHMEIINQELLGGKNIIGAFSEYYDKMVSDVRKDILTDLTNHNCDNEQVYLAKDNSKKAIQVNKKREDVFNRVITHYLKELADVLYEELSY
jgi:hypothetical protein